MRDKMMLVLLFMLYIILTTSGLILFKLGTNVTDFNFNIFGLHLALSYKMLLGIICYGFSFLLWLYLVSKNNLTIIMPLSVAITNTLIVLCSLYFLHEKITLLQGIGIFIIIFGVVLTKWGGK